MCVCVVVDKTPAILMTDSAIQYQHDLSLGRSMREIELVYQEMNSFGVSSGMAMRLVGRAAM
jgi:hypothetical protein